MYQLFVKSNSKNDSNNKEEGSEGTAIVTIDSSKVQLTLDSTTLIGIGQFAEGFSFFFSFFLSFFFFFARCAFF